VNIVFTWFIRQVPICAALIRPSDLGIVAEGSDCSTLDPLGHATMNCIEDCCKNSKEGDYLCSGLWLLLTREPCAMCAMAAVHSRVGMVIYGCENEELGALGSRYTLHLEKQLNHHYTVFKHLLRYECSQIWGKYSITNTVQ